MSVNLVKWGDIQWDIVRSKARHSPWTLFGWPMWLVSYSGSGALKSEPVFNKIDDRVYYIRLPWADRTVKDGSRAHFVTRWEGFFWFWKA